MIFHNCQAKVSHSYENMSHNLPGTSGINFVMLMKLVLVKRHIFHKYEKDHAICFRQVFLISIKIMLYGSGRSEIRIVGESFFTSMKIHYYCRLSCSTLFCVSSSSCRRFQSASRCRVLYSRFQASMSCAGCAVLPMKNYKSP